MDPIEFNKALNLCRHSLYLCGHSITYQLMILAIHIQLEGRDVVIDFTSTNLVLSVQDAL